MNLNQLLPIAGFRANSLEFPNAWVGHLPFAAWLIKEVNPKIFVELGTHSGNSYFSFCQSILESQLQTRSHAVDTWKGDEHAGGYTNEVYAAVAAHNSKYYSEFSRLLRMTFDQAAGYFSDKSIGLLHIDGLHTYDAVRHDYERWLPKLVPGAVVIFHDINVRERDFGVWKLWGELKLAHPNNIEFVHSNGLGVLQLNNVPDGEKIEWLRPGLPEKLSIVSFFAAVGARQLERFEAKELSKQYSKHQQAYKDLKQQVIDLNRTIEGQRSKVGELERALRDKDAELLARNLLTNELQSEVSQLLKTVDKHSKAAQHANQTVRLRDEHIAAILESPSWWLTSPVRLFGRQYNRVRRVMRLMGPAIQRAGGVTATLKTALRFYKRDGLAGIRRGMQMAESPNQMLLPPVGRINGNNYTEWVGQFDTLTDKARDVMHSTAKNFAVKPLVSILMPVYNSPLEFLDQAIHSVRNQLYTNWELCIADDASTNLGVRKLLASHASQDQRISIVYREANGHISRASNSALEVAKGEFTALLDHDDLLAETALFRIVEAINNMPEVGLIYSDEDKIRKDGTRYDPYFKCDLNYELLLAQNMVSHLSVYRTAILREIGGFREGFEGAQDYDLSLRVIEQLAPEQIVHLPRVLYHWRAIAGSTALGAGEKNYAAEAGRRAVREHLQRRGVSAEVMAAPEAPAMNRVRFSCPSPPPKVSIIIPTRDRADLLKMCLDSIAEASSYTNYEVIIIDNGSVEAATHTLLDALPKHRYKILRDESPFNFSALNNMAAKAATGDILCLMNNDIEVLTPDWLEEMVSFATQPGVGCVGARLWYPDGRLQHGGCVLGIGGICGHSHKYLEKGKTGYFGRAALHQSFSAVTAACLVVRRDVFEEVGGLDEKLVIAFNDVDFCLRVREAGYRNVWTPYAEMNHHESASRGLEDTVAKQNRFLGEIAFIKSRWGDQLLNDPAYSSNLSLDIEDFSYAWPPRTILT